MITLSLFLFANMKWVLIFISFFLSICVSQEKPLLKFGYSILKILQTVKMKFRIGKYRSNDNQGV